MSSEANFRCPKRLCMQPSSHDILIVIDVQNDFCAGA